MEQCGSGEAQSVSAVLGCRDPGESKKGLPRPPQNAFVFCFYLGVVQMLGVLGVALSEKMFLRVNRSCMLGCRFGVRPGAKRRVDQGRKAEQCLARVLLSMSLPLGDLLGSNSPSPLTAGAGGRRSPLRPELQDSLACAHGPGLASGCPALCRGRARRAP